MRASKPKSPRHRGSAMNPRSGLKDNLTTKSTKDTKVLDTNILTLRDLRVLRGENTSFGREADYGNTGVERRPSRFSFDFLPAGETEFPAPRRRRGVRRWSMEFFAARRGRRRHGTRRRRACEPPTPCATASSVPY